MKKNPSIDPFPPQRTKPRSPIAIALSVALFPIWFPFWAYGVFLAAQFDRTRDFSKWLYGRYECYRYGGFTLIELAIVLVIIGLIVGGVLTGQHLIGAATVRAEITQIEKFNAAANTFFEKYSYLPGDIPPSLFTRFGFTAAPGRTGNIAGLGNGDGHIDGYNFSSSATYPVDHTGGESEWFWEDLSTNSKLIEGGFSKGNATQDCPNDTDATTSAAIALFLPPAKIGGGNFITVNDSNGRNYLTVSNVSEIGGSNGDTFANVGLTVTQAYNIDMKVDDGLPQSGNVLAEYNNHSVSYNVLSWANGTGTAGASPGTVATPSATTCYDNGGNTSNPMAYSVTQNNGNGVNCALSFRLQAGD